MGQDAKNGLAPEAGTSNVRFYKSPEHFAAPEIVEPWIEDEFPHRKSIPEVNRRDMLKMMGGAALLAGLGGCRFQPQRKIVPFVQQPEDAVSGAHKLFASSAVKDGFHIGVLVDQVDGRPVRVDGNPLHAASGGRLDSRTMSEILNLYDPDRLKTPEYRGTPFSWNRALTEIEATLAASVNGTGVRVLSETVNSPTLARLITKLKTKYPELQWHQYDAVNRDNAREGAVLAYGADLHTAYDFTRADVVVSLDADFLQEGPMSVAYSQAIASRRIPTAEMEMSRIYAVESRPTTIGITADHRARIKPSEAFAFVMSLAANLGVPGAVTASLPASVDQKFFEALAEDMAAKRGAALIVPGDHLPPAVHAACHAVNSFLGGPAVVMPNPLPMPVNHGKSLKDLVDAMNAGTVDMLLILGGNPAYTAPADLKFAEALAKVKGPKVCLSTHFDETCEVTDYQLPMAHFLEAWGDGIAFDGTVSITQPLIEPLYEGRSVLEVMDKLIGEDGEPRRLVMETHAGSNTKRWKELVASGIVPPAQVAQMGADPAPALTTNLLGSLNVPAPASGLELLVLPDPCVHDGRHANNNWLQETPKPITNLTWDNALYVSKATADKLGVVAPYDKKLAGIPYYGKADMVEVTANGQTLEVPVWVNMGQADDVLILTMGYGRTRGGEFATKRDEASGGGFNANVLRSSVNPVWISGVQVKKTGKEYVLANTQHHNTIDFKVEDRDRHLLKETTPEMLAKGLPFGEHGDGHYDPYKDDPKAAQKKDFGEFGKKPDITMYPGQDFAANPETNYQWAMTIDLSLCTGCNACVTACQAENNIPTVGKDQVQRGRELHWMRVDRYYKGDGQNLDMDNPPIYVQPVTCMHCEQAPCEPVCPVAATVHSHEGLNQMVYNRCVGTRYCSNNCPYKVRRYNFFHYSQRADQIPVLKMLQNPEVTVRYRGVMEKCTYCVQRINKARITAKKQDREIADGEVVVACQSACPSNAIVFGDMRRPVNAVAKSRADQRNYLLLEELNTRPRTTYLSRVRNPHPKLAPAHKEGH